MRVAIGFGSNLGDRGSIVKKAVRDVRIIGEVVAISSLYRSAPVGGPEQSDYLNGVVVVDTNLQPDVVLAMALGIEERHGRVRATRWGARTLDLDVLVIDELKLDSEKLTVPHPRLANRRFALQPLAEVWPEADVGGISAAEALGSSLDQDVTLVARIGWENFSERGAKWVAVQGLLFLLLIATALFDVGSLGDWPSLRWVGRAVVVLAGLEMWLGLRALGSNLTAYPEPIDEGQLIDTGILGLVRHPLYGANVLIFLGVALHQNSRLGLILAVATAIFFWQKSEHEESRLMQKYPTYHLYRQRVSRRLVPWLI